MYLNVSAARACREANPSVEVTAEMVLQHMTQRAQEEPLVASILMWSRYTDLCFMIEESYRGEVGESGNMALFLAAQRMATNLLCCTNAFNYLHTQAVTQKGRTGCGSSSVNSFSAPKLPTTDH